MKKHLAEKQYQADDEVIFAVKDFFDSHMFYVGNEGKEKRLVLYTAEERSKAFDECHIMPVTGEHCGRTKTLRRLTDKYYWTCMVEDVVALIVKCKTCEFNKASRPNQRFFRVTEPWEVVSIDIIGQFTATDRGHAFVAVMIDMFTKYSIAIPVRDTLVADMSEAVRQCIFQQGPPKRFISDQSEEFIKELNYALEVESSVTANIIPVGRTQANRPDEANIKTAILKWCVEVGSTWDDSLTRKLYEINTSYLTAAGHTPFYLLYHRHPRPLCSTDPIQFSGTTKPAFVVRDVERHIKEREQKTTEIINQVLSGRSQQSAKQSDRYVPSTAVEHPQACEYETAVHIVPDPIEADQDTSQYTHVTHITEGQLMSAAGSSMYDMSDGEGQVVVVADGISNLEEESSGNPGHMVVVQQNLAEQDLAEQGVIMLNEGQVLVEGPDGQHYAYVPES